MNRFFAILLTALTPLVCFAEQPDRKETIALLNRAGERLMRGDVSALDDIKALPGDDAVSGLLFFFKQNYNVYKARPEQKAIAARSAQYATEVPAAKAWFGRLFRKDEARPTTPALARQRGTALDCLTAAQNRFSFETLLGLLDDPESDIPVSDIGITLARMDIQGAPYTKAASRGTSTPEGIAKWKAWWEANKSRY